MQFKPCTNRNFCTEDGDLCRGCGRTHLEIARTRELTDQLAEFILAMDYENVDDFATYIANKAIKKVAARRKHPGPT